MEREKYNGAKSVRFEVKLSFVSPDEQAGYQRTEIVQCESRYEAITRTITKHLKEDLPLRGIDVYENVFCA